MALDFCETVRGSQGWPSFPRSYDAGLFDLAVRRLSNTSYHTAGLRFVSSNLVHERYHRDRKQSFEDGLLERGAQRHFGNSITRVR